MSPNGDGVERDAVLQHLERVLSSTPFRQAERSAVLLRFLVERSLDGAGDRLKEYTVGREALGRGPEFDPRTDPIVRAEASRLRARLDRYYAGEGQSDALVIELPKGAYAARFNARPLPVDAPTSEVPSPPQSRSARPPILWRALGLLALCGAFGLGVWSARSSSSAKEPRQERLEVQLQTDERVASDVGTDVIIAPDGSRAVYASVDSLGGTHLRVRRFDETAPTDLPGTTGARGPFWSPDSRWIGFWAAGKLRKIAVDGGSPVALCDAPDLLGASWSDDGTIIAAFGTTRLQRIDARSGEMLDAIVDLGPDNAAPRWPQVLPDGKHVLYTAITAIGADEGNIEIASLVDGKRKVIAERATFGRYVAPNYLTFVNQSTLYAKWFNLARLETREPQVSILDDVAYSETFGYAQISIAETGVAVYRRGIGPLIVARIDSAGRQTPVLEQPGRYSWPSLSPDGQQLALAAVESGVSSLSVFTNLNGRPRLAWNRPGYQGAVWTHDGQHIVARKRGGIDQLSAATGQSLDFFKSEKTSVPWTFTADDRQLAFAAMDRATVFDLWLVPVEKRGETLHAGVARAILRTPFFETYPTISPDGRWLAYWSNASGSSEVYVRSLADSSVQVPIAADARVPRWSSTDQRLFFSTSDQRIMVTSYTTPDGRFVPGTPRQWTSVRLADLGVLPNYDLGPDARYIIALLPARPLAVQTTNHVTRINDLSAELRRKVP